MGNFLERQKLPKSLKRIDNLNSPMFFKDTEFIFSYIYTDTQTHAQINKCQAQKISLVNSTLKKQTIAILHKCLKKTKERLFLNSFHEFNPSLIPKLDKGITIKDNCRPISLINTDLKIKNFSKWNITIC